MALETTKMSHHEVRKNKNLKNKKRREEIFNNFKPWAAIFIMVLPTILSSLIFSTYQIFDKWIATQWGGNSIVNNNINSTTALKIINIATTYSTVPSSLMVAFSSLASIGTAVKFSINYGRNNREKMANYVGNGFVLSFSLSIIFMIIMYFAIVPIINFQSNGDNQVSNPLVKEIISQQAIKFSRILVLATPLLFFSNFWLILLRSEGRVVSNIFIIVFSCILNISLDFLFVIVFNLGMAGTACATIIAWVFNFSSALILIYVKESNLAIKLKNLKIKKAIIVSILLLGVTSFLQNGAQSIISMVTIKILNNLPPLNYPNEHSSIPIYIQLYGGIMPWLFLLNAPLIGISQGSRALVGYIYGSKNYYRLWQILLRLFLLIFLFLTLTLLIVVAFGQYMMNFFGVNLHMAEHFKAFIILQFAFYPLATLHFMVIIFFQGTGKSKIALIAGLQRTIVSPIITLISGYFIAIATKNGFYFYLFLGLKDLLAALILLPLVIFSIKKNKLVIKNSKKEYILKNQNKVK